MVAELSGGHKHIGRSTHIDVHSQQWIRNAIGRLKCSQMNDELRLSPGHRIDDCLSVPDITFDQFQSIMKPATDA
jgi:hypothetical protein